jgi:acetyltransferase-like isoleucine patch superfamily enzyme|tara:strand:- start:938 stop:1465 length:528 start_codon:yes stop_codon:yes gene_type:complete
MKDPGYLKINENELMKYFGYEGKFGKIKLNLKFGKSWIYHVLGYSSPFSNWVVKCQRNRGVKIGENCHISPYVLIDLIYPGLIEISDNVTIGSNSMIFAHVNPTANEFLKKHGYPRTVKPVKIKKGAVVSVGCIIIAGVTIGENSIVGAGSVVASNIPDNCVAIGNPARVIKKIE